MNLPTGRRFPPDPVKIALRKLDILNDAYRLYDLRSPPANRLEALQGDLAGFHSICANEIVRGKPGVIPETAWLFAEALGTSPEFWLNLQTNYDLVRFRPKRQVQRMSAIV